ncbi:hypothetical protein B0H19DRAFT_1384949 [Mycena capillaripes]|nr:hypothetical protein B0H19DRAFT_1384949 [Mycena capillaripes]
MDPTVFFLDLTSDVIFCIFAYCDVSAVVSTAQTCRYLHNLAFDKSIWLVLLGNLRRRRILDRTCAPCLEDLSTEELIQVVKSLLTGPQSWSPQTAGSKPEISRQITLHPSLSSGPLSYENSAKLLPSGRYVLFNNWGTLEWWSVTEDQLIWKSTSAMANARVLQFATEEPQGENSLVIMMCSRINSPAATNRSNYVEIVNVSRNGEQNVLVTAVAPDSMAGRPFHGPVIHGPLAAVTTNMRLDEIMIVNWRTLSGEPPSRPPFRALPAPPVLPIALPVTGLPEPVPEAGT